MIYLTSFDPETKEVLARSEDSGFASLAEVRAAMGDNTVTQSRRLLIYEGGLAFSDYPFRIDPITTKS